MERYYIKFETARELLKRSVKNLKAVKVPVVEALGCVLAEDIHSPVDLPLWTNSAVDGFAFNTKSLKNLPAKLKVIAEIRAGDSRRLKVGVQEAVKLFTGSVVPEGADAVIEVEKVEFDQAGWVTIKSNVEKGSNIRFKGEEVRKGEKVLERGIEVTPGVVGFLSTMGISKVKVYKRPSVLVVITGEELLKPGERVKYGKIYDANSALIITAFKKVGISEFKVKYSGDDFTRIRRIFLNSVGKFDLIVFTGGISVGDYDMVRELFFKERVKRIFYKVRQRPGKPIFLGEKGASVIFGLPGNPASVLTCFYEYVYPVIRKMMGFGDIFLPEEEKILLNDIKKKSDRLYFLRGKVRGDGVEVLKNQGSHMLSSFARCDCFVLAPSGRSFIKKGEKVKIHRIL